MVMTGTDHATWLRKEAAGLFDAGDVVDSDGESAEAGSAFVLFAEVKEVFEGLVELGFELGEHFDFAPTEALQVLHPLEVTDSDTAGIAEDVGEEEDVAAFLDDGIGWLGGGAVGGFGEDFAAEFGRVFFGDDAFEGGWDEDVAFAEEHFIRVDGFGVGETGDTAGLCDVFAEFEGVEALVIPDGSGDIGDTLYFHAVCVHRFDGVGSDISEALHDRGGSSDREVQLVQGAGGEEGDAVAGGLGAALAALELDRFSGDDFRNEAAFAS